MEVAADLPDANAADAQEKSNLSRNVPWRPHEYWR
jgi:hypothetical protein